MMRGRWWLLMGLSALTLACSSGSQTVTSEDVGADAAETSEEAPDLVLAETAAPDLEGEPDVALDLGTADVAPELLPECRPGEGCFLDTCVENSDCLSGWCVEYLGEGVCTQACQEECPPGWSCKLLGGTGPDPVYVCLSDYSNLCKPCAAAADCQSPAGQQDACIQYGDEGSFCGGNCTGDEDCPWGFSCAEAATVDGISTWQCVADAGTCPCSEKSVELGLWTPCETANEFGACAGKRVCTEDGLSACDADVPAEEVCNGLDDDCDGDVDEPDEVDGDYVNLCDDGNECTVNTCAGESGCQVEVLDQGECKDGDACTVGDHCEAGVCVGNPVLCDDNNPCTDDACDGLGGCEFVDNFADCDDGNPCTVADQCTEGTCVGTGVPCDCQVDDDCVALEDGDLCNGTLFCDLEEWPYQCKVIPGSVVSCPEPEGVNAPCLAATCDPQSGACGTTPVHEGLACDDGDACTVGDACVEGTCTPGVAANCADDNPCTDDLCDPEGGCVHQANELPCEDGNPCTVGDGCLDGECVAGGPAACDDGNPCTDDSCEPAVGCVHAANAEPCDDGNACTTGDHCINGGCAWDELVVCDDGNVCTTDSCSPDGGCLFALNQAPCDDGDLCTTGDHCHLGECISAGTLTCNDGNICTDDSCDPQTGCLFAANEAPCDDGSLCTIGGQCSGGWCIGGQPIDCNDGNGCTDDSCQPLIGCVHNSNAAACDDGNACTTGDSCANGLCQPGDSVDCDDGNVCTDDSCAPESGCLHTPNDAACEGGVCQDGACVAYCDPVFYGWAGIGVNNGWTCTNVCAADDAVSTDWLSLQEQIEYCHALHPGAEVFTASPSNFSYPIYEPQNDRCKLNADGSQSQDYAGNGTAEYGDQILCRCLKDCPCIPDCEGKECGDNGCGGLCGTCAPDQSCLDHQCVDCVPGSQAFQYTGQIVSWVVPSCATQITVEAWGAEGGRNTDDDYLGGRGARMRGSFAVAGGTELRILVGGKGEDVKANAGGGGGSFVWQHADQLLLVAAGGGGGGGYDNAGLDAVTGEDGTPGNGLPAGGGVGGYGGTAPAGYDYLGGGGAGWLGNGSPGKTSPACSLATPAKRPLEGGQGGAYGGEPDWDGDGGFGGGGGGQGGCTVSGGAGGGGGYSGGGPGGYLSPDIRGGGGGGSYNEGMNQSNQGGVRAGHGQVVITW